MVVGRKRVQSTKRSRREGDQRDSSVALPKQKMQRAEQQQTASDKADCANADGREMKQQVFQRSSMVINGRDKPRLQQQQKQKQRRGTAAAAAAAACKRQIRPQNWDGIKLQKGGEAGVQQTQSAGEEGGGTHQR